jgi:hypothetical protein
LPIGSLGPTASNRNNVTVWVSVAEVTGSGLYEKVHPRGVWEFTSLPRKGDRFNLAGWDEIETMEVLYVDHGTVNIDRPLPKGGKDDPAFVIFAVSCSTWFASDA